MTEPKTPPHHTPKGFRNPPGSPRRTTTFRDMVRFMARRWSKDREMPELPDGHRVPEDEARTQLAALNGRDSLTWLGHASFLVRLGGRTILTDPYLTDFASPLAFTGPRRFVPPGISIENLPPIDALLLSHNHYDHLDLRSIARIPGKERLLAVVPLGLGRYFRRRGYQRVREVDWHDRVDLGGVTITALPAIHFSRRGLFDRNKSLWLSAAIESDAQRLYFSGDTAHGPVFKEIGARYGPFDLAMVGIAAYLPRRIMHASHTNPEEAVRLGLDIGARILVGMHWGTVVLTDEPAFEPPGWFRRAATEAGFDEDRAWLMRIGESRALPAPWPGN